MTIWTMEPDLDRINTMADQTLAANQLWEIRITDPADRLVCISRLTMAVLARGKDR